MGCGPRPSKGPIELHLADTKGINVKVLQSLGKAKGQTEATFRYRRSSTGVTIDASINANYNQTPKQITLSHAEWNAILTAVENAPNETFRITNTGAPGDQPTQSLNPLFAGA